MPPTQDDQSDTMTRDNPTNSATFGELLRVTRDARRLTQEQLGLMLETRVSQGAVSHWERGTAIPGFLEVFELERVLELPPGYLSHTLGFLPLGEATQCTVQQAIAADPLLSDVARRSLLAMYGVLTQNG